jgi:predicted dehydrogenase
VARIPVALVGVDHPHVKDWQGVLERVSEVELVALYDPHPAAARAQLLPTYAQLPLYDSVADLLAKQDIQAALVLLPLSEAEEAMLPLAAAGIHMMAEKPVARTAAGLQRVARVLKPGTAFYSGYAWRCDPIIQTMGALVEQGILGDLWSIEMRWITSKVGRRPGVPPHRDPRSYLFRREQSRGGMLQWLGCHWLDLMLHIPQQDVAAVSAMTSRQTSDEIEVDDSATCLLRYKSGMLGSLHVGYFLPSGTDAFWGIRGSLGSIRWEFQDGRRFTVHSDHPSWKVSPTRVFEFPAGPEPSYGAGTGMLLIQDFARCIRDKGANPLLTLDDALNVLRLLDAAYESDATGRAVALS